MERHMSIPCRVVITGAVLGAIHDLPACGVVVYGSVAAGTATTSSDLDTLILTEHDLAESAGDQLRERFVAMQLRLGLQPDLQYPVELFSLAAATGSLARAK